MHMPEASVHVYDLSVAGQNDVWVAWQITAVETEAVA